MGKVLKIGIDLGTTNTVVCYPFNGKYQFLRFGRDAYLPSVVLVEEGTNRLIVGQKAYNLSKRFPRRFIRSSKTHIGEFDYSYPKSVENMDIGDLRLTPTDVAAAILREVKENILGKKAGGEDIQDIEAVITVPAYFKSTSIDETIRAAEMAGLHVKRIVGEPNAAAVAYVREDIGDDTRIFVVDFGGGTLDLTLLRYQASSANGSYIEEAKGGDNHLGGDNIDECIMQYLIKRIKEDDYRDLSSQSASGFSKEEYAQLLWMLRREARQLKEDFAAGCDDYVEVAIPDLYKRENNTFYSLEDEIFVEDFEEICQPVMQKFRESIMQTINAYEIDVTKIDRIVLVGGSCYMPQVKRIVEEIFEKKPYESDLARMVALGACMVANEELKELSENLAYDLGMEVLDESADNQKRFDTLIPRNTRVPCSGTKEYTTVVDQQPAVRVNVYERGNTIPESNCSLQNCDFFGSLIFSDFQKAPKGVPKISIRFDFDTNRRLTVTVTDKLTGQSKKVQLNKSEKLRMESATAPMDIVLMIDVSISMDSYFNKVVQAVIKLADSMIDMKTHRIGIVQFEETEKSRVVCGLTHDFNRIGTAISKMKAEGSSTHIVRALKLSENELRRSDPERNKVIIMLTDGVAFDSKKEIKDTVKSIKDHNIRLITIGAGRVDEQTLMDISSRNNGRPEMYSIQNMEQLANTFETIIDSLKTI